MESKKTELTKIIDQLILYSREKYHLRISDNEKFRLKTVVDHILINKEISIKDWELIKPIIPEAVGVIENRKSQLKKDRIDRIVKEVRELNQDVIDETEKIQKRRIELQSEMRIYSASVSGKLPARSVSKFCTKCKKRLTEGEYEKHIKVCGKKKIKLK